MAVGNRQARPVWCDGRQRSGVGRASTARRMFV